MPSRGRRIAARQAQLSRRKKRDHGSANIPVGQPPPTSADFETPGLSNAASTTATVQAESRAVSTPPPRRVEQRHSVYHYVGPEMRRILILTGVIVAVLVIASLLIK